MHLNWYETTENGLLVVSSIYKPYIIDSWSILGSNKEQDQKSTKNLQIDSKNQQKYYM